MLTKSHLLNDVRASIVVFLVALPLCLGISLASGAPLVSGLIAGIVGGLVVGAISSSKTSVSGPAAGLTVIVINSLQQLGGMESFAVAVMLAGVMQLILAWAKAGNAGSFFPSSVIKGMLAAIGLILVLKQLPVLLGISAADKVSVFDWYSLVQPAPLLIGAISVFFMLGWDKYLANKSAVSQYLPAPLMVVVLGIVLNWILEKFSVGLSMTADQLVNLPVQHGIAGLVQGWQGPDWSVLTNPIMYQVALTLAVVASLETLLSVEAVDKIDPQKRTTNKNRELFAQGSGNLLSGFLGGLPITSVIVRSSANINAGNSGKLSAIMHGAWILLAVGLLGSVLQLIPLASLAAILLLVGLKLCPFNLFIQMWRNGADQWVPFFATVVAILATDLLTGILIGMGVSFITVIKAGFSRSIVVINEGDFYLVRFMKDVYFLQKPFMKKVLSSIPEGASVVIDGSNHLYVDDDIVEMIDEFLKIGPQKGIQCQIVRSSMAKHHYFKE